MKSLLFLLTSLLFLLPQIGFSQDLRPEVSELVQKISNSGSLGFDQDHQYQRFTHLNAIAGTEELVLLTNHESPAVRGYAFWSLAKRNYPELKSIFIAHLDDKAKVLQKNGCMVGDESVISFMKQVVTPYMYDPDCKKLDDATRALVK